MPTDPELLYRLAPRDESAFDALVARHAGAARRRAEELRLSLAGHVARDPSVLTRVLAHAPVFGLALLSRSKAGRQEVERLAEGRVDAPDGFVTKAGLGRALLALAQRAGARAALDAADRLLAPGLEVARGSGASISPFADAWLDAPEDEGEASLLERIESSRAFEDDLLGPQLLAVLSGARGTPGWLLGFLRPPVDRLLAAGSMRAALAEVAWELAERTYEAKRAALPTSYGVRSRAARSRRPGVVFAQAASSGESDPLRDPWTRLFVGLPE